MALWSIIKRPEPDLTGFLHGGHHGMLYEYGWIGDETPGCLTVIQGMGIGSR